MSPQADWISCSVGVTETVDTEKQLHVINAVAG